jgi:hypothetical protein
MTTSDYFGTVNRIHSLRNYWRVKCNSSINTRHKNYVFKTYLVLASCSSRIGNVNLKFFFAVASALTNVPNFHLLVLKLGENSALASSWLWYMTPYTPPPPPARLIQTQVLWLFQEKTWGHICKNFMTWNSPAFVIHERDFWLCSIYTCSYLLKRTNMRILQCVKMRGMNCSLTSLKPIASYRRSVIIEFLNSCAFVN